MSDAANWVERFSVHHRTGQRGRYKALCDTMIDALTSRFRRLLAQFATRNPHSAMFLLLPPASWSFFPVSPFLRFSVSPVPPCSRAQRCSPASLVAFEGTPNPEPRTLTIELRTSPAVKRRKLT